MVSPNVILNEHIDQLVIWLRENKDVKMLSSQKKRLITILNRIINCETLSEEEFKVPKHIEFKPMTPVSPKSTNTGYVPCRQCGAEINVKNRSRHKKKCRGRNQVLGRNVAVTKTQTKRKPKGAIFSDKPYYNELKIERRLDGARDYWANRDQGRFGSHSSYDDMGDESSS